MYYGRITGLIALVKTFQNTVEHTCGSDLALHARLRIVFAIDGILRLVNWVTVTVNGKAHKVPGHKLQKWIMKRREEWKGPRGLLFKQRPTFGP